MALRAATKASTSLLSSSNAASMDIVTRGCALDLCGPLDGKAIVELEVICSLSDIVEKSIKVVSDGKCG